MEKNFTEKDSLELISQMISDKRRSFEKNNAQIMLLWGYLLSITAIAMYVFSLNGINIAGYWWIPIVLVGYLVSRLLMKNKVKKVSYLDKVFRYVWEAVIVVALATAIYYGIDVGIRPIYGAVLLFGSLGMYITGRLLESKTIYYLSLFGFVLGGSILFRAGSSWIPFEIEFAIGTAVMLIVSGHIMLNKAKKEQ